MVFRQAGEVVAADGTLGDLARRRGSCLFSMAYDESKVETVSPLKRAGEKDRAGGNQS